MSEQDIFIGREKELQMIDQVVFDPTGARHILRIVGKGGTGKTWLLREVGRRYQQEPRVVVIKIDYGNVRHQSLPSLSRSILNQIRDFISEEEFNSFINQFTEWEELPSVGASIDEINAKQSEIYEKGILLINNKIATKKRILILSDTGESTESNTDFSYKTSFYTSQFANTVGIIASRSAQLAIDPEEYYKIYKNWKIHEFYELGAYSFFEVDLYLNAVLSVKLEPKLCKKITLLTGGNPVLVAIAGEWLRRNIALPKDIDLPLKELQALDEAQLAKRRQLFEFALIEKVRALRKPIDWATLYLAYLNRRYDPKILEVTLNLNKFQLKLVIEDLKTLVFVRKSMSAEGGLLHDEAQRLIQQHAWPVVDPDGKIRRELAQKVIDGYYKPEIARLDKIVHKEWQQSVDHKLAALEHRSLPPIPDEDWLKRELQIECLDYHFRISDEVGWAYLERLFDEALNSRYSLTQMDAIVHAVHNLAPKLADSARFKVHVSQTLLAKGELKSAVRMAETVLNEPDVSPSNATEAWILLGATTTDPTKKIDFLQAALKKAKDAQDKALEARVYNALGLAHRRQGQWAEAIGDYRQVLQLLDPKRDRTQYANTLNNLGFAYMFTSHLTRADSYAEKALRIRKAQGNIRGLSFSFATKGRIAEAMGDYTQALIYHRTAFELAESVGDKDNAAIWQTNIAAAERRAHHFEAARQLLADGLTSDNPRVRARAFHQAAKINRDEAKALQNQEAPLADVTAKYESAVQNAQQALALARKIGDQHQEAAILLDLAVVTYLNEQREDTVQLDALRDILKDHDYKLEKGRLEELMGDLAYIQADVRTAFEHYLNACEMLAGSRPATFRQTFGRVRAKFLDAEPETQALICQMIESEFAGVHRTSPLVALNELCLDEFADF